jgi:hypothetical protein
VSQNVVFVLSVVGIAIGGADGYWQIHSNIPVLDAKFYVGLLFGTIAPVGTYLVGLTQRSPWEARAAAQRAADAAKQ